MLHDKGNDFWYGSTALQVTGGAGLAVLSPSIDLKSTSRKIFAGTPVDIHAQITTAAAGGTSVQLTLEDSADDVTFATVKNSTTQVVQSAVIPLAELVAGYEFSFPYSANTVVRRYLRLSANVIGTFTATVITAGLIDKRQTNHLS